MIRVSFEEFPVPNLMAFQSFRIQTLTHVFDNPDWFYNFHSHDDSAEIIYIEGGRGIYTLGNVSYSATTGNLLVINPGVLHSLSSDRQMALNAWTLTITGFSLPGLKPNRIIPDSAYPMIRLKNMEEYFRQNFSLIFDQYKKYRQGTAQSESAAYAAAISVLLMASQLITPGKHPGQKKKSGDDGHSNDFAVEVLRYIDRHFHEPITLERLSDEFHISAGHISHAMSREFGISPINYLISRRIGEAQWLLLTTALSVNEIAHQVGYENAYHFTQLFTKRVGMRPQEFRERFQTGAGREDSRR